MHTSNEKYKTYRGGNVGASNTLDWGIQVVESVAFDDLSTDLAANAEHGEATLGDNEPVRLLDGCLDGIDVERTDGTEVDDLGLDTLFCELLSGLQRVSDHFTVSNDGHITSFSLDLGLSDREEEVFGHGLSGHGEGDTVKHLVLQENHWVGIPNGRLENRQVSHGNNSHKGTNYTLRSPLQSSALHGETTLRPGIEPYQAA